MSPAEVIENNSKCHSADLTASVTTVAFEWLSGVIGASQEGTQSTVDLSGKLQSSNCLLRFVFLT